MREEPKGHQHRPHQIPALAGHSIVSLEVHTLRQLHQLELQGARFAERLASPVVIRNPLCEGQGEALISTRWLGGGVFGIVVHLKDGELASGWIPIRAAMGANPDLTPSGTLSTERWDKDIFSQRSHVVPGVETFMRGVRAAGQSLAAELLEVFPERIDLSSESDDSRGDRGLMTEVCQTVLSPFSQELRDGLKVVDTKNSTGAELQTWISQVVDTNLRNMATTFALQIFRETRLHVAVFQHEQRMEDGIIHDLIVEGANATVAVAQKEILEAIRRNPFSSHRDIKLERHSVVGLRASMLKDPRFIELWKHLGQEERRSIVEHIAESAWRSSVRAYALRN